MNLPFEFSHSTFLKIRQLRFVKHCVYFILSLCLLLSFEAASQEKVLKIGVSLGDPFVISHNNEFQGIAVDIWKLMAEELNLAYEFVPMGEHIDDAVSQLAMGKIDMLIGPVVPTYERYKKVDFMQPYYLNQIGLVIPLKKISFLTAVGSIFNSTVNYLLIIFIFCFIIYLHVFWYYEKQSNKDYLPETYGKGLVRTFWLHSLNIDLGRIPAHQNTRIFRLFWIILLTLFFSSITAALTSALTVALSNRYAQFDNANDFKNKKITAVVATAPYEIAKEMGFDVVPANSREKAFELLLDEKVAAYVDYYPIADYYINQHELTHQLIMANVILKRDTFAFALPINSAYLHPFNLKLRYYQDYGFIKTLCDKYFGTYRNSGINCEL